MKRFVGHRVVVTCPLDKITVKAYGQLGALYDLLDMKSRRFVCPYTHPNFHVFELEYTNPVFFVTDLEPLREANISFAVVGEEVHYEFG